MTNQIPKFRAWHIKYKVMYEVFVIDFEDKRVLVGGMNNPEIRHWLDFKEIELMQWTGLVDLDKTLIYEGDIVIEKLKYENIGPAEVRYGRFESSHEGGHSRHHFHIGFSFWRGENQVWGYCDEDLNIDGLEVIGTKWKNPELLTDD